MTLYIYSLQWGEYVFYKSILFFLNKNNHYYDSLSSLIENETTDFRTTSIFNLHCILVFQYFHKRVIYWIFSLTLFGMGKYFYPNILLKLNFSYIGESWHKSSLFDTLPGLLSL